MIRSRVLPQLRIVPTEADLAMTHDDQRALYVKERHVVYSRLLHEARSITVEQLADAMDALRESRPEIVDHLARGPRGYRYDCTICNAFKTYRDRDDFLDAIDIDDPLWVVWMFHEVPKSMMKHSHQLHEGRFANMVYDRCIVTYRLAGWEGQAPEPNA